MGQTRSEQIGTFGKLAMFATLALAAVMLVLAVRPTSAFADAGARIGDVEYEDLYFAMRAATEEDATDRNIVMLADDEDVLDIYKPSSMESIDITIDFNGHTLSYEKGSSTCFSPITVHKGVNLTLKNVKIASEGACITSYGGSVTIESAQKNAFTCAEDIWGQKSAQYRVFYFPNGENRGTISIPSGKSLYEAEESTAGNVFDLVDSKSVIGKAPAWVSLDGVPTLYFRTYAAAKKYASSSKLFTAYRTVKVTLFNTSFAYNGKVQQPKIKSVFGGDEAVTDYEVTSLPNSKKVGTYTVKVLCDGVSSGQATYTINPKSVTGLKVKKGKKSFKASWTKYTTERAGVQLRYSKYKSMKKAKTVKVSGSKAKAKTVKKLKKKTKYYVQVRSYKVVKGKTYYSSWSAKKSVKTK